MNAASLSGSGAAQAQLSRSLSSTAPASVTAVAMTKAAIASPAIFAVISVFLLFNSPNLDRVIPYCKKI
jgi:hypothetical protein